MSRVFKERKRKKPGFSCDLLHETKSLNGHGSDPIGKEEIGKSCGDVSLFYAFFSG